MFNSPLPTAVSESKGTIHLCARVLVGSAWLECQILDASAETQRARVMVPGRGQAIVSFHQVANVALKYTDGTVIESFGAPRVSNPASLQYIQYASV